MYFPNLLELSFRSVLAFPKAFEYKRHTMSLWQVPVPNHARHENGGREEELGKEATLCLPKRSH